MTTRSSLDDLAVAGSVSDILVHDISHIFLPGRHFWVHVPHVLPYVVLPSFELASQG
jgi:hypothetical protein